MFGMQVQSQGKEGGLWNFIIFKGGAMKKYFE
jgi:hypothetical protein